MQILDLLLFHQYHIFHVSLKVKTFLINITFDHQPLQPHLTPLQHPILSHLTSMCVCVCACLLDCRTRDRCPELEQSLTSCTLSVIKPFQNTQLFYRRLSKIIVTTKVSEIAVEPFDWLHLDSRHLFHSFPSAFNSEPHSCSTSFGFPHFSGALHFSPAQIALQLSSLSFSPASHQRTCSK